MSEITLQRVEKDSEAAAFFKALCSPRFSLRPLQADDLNRVLKWRNHPRVRQQMVNREPITRDQHQRWYDRLQDQQQQLQLMALHQGQAVAICNLSAMEDRAWYQAEVLEAGYYVGSDTLQGSLMAFGPALLTLRAAFENLPCHRICARVRAGNLAAVRFNQQLGYQTVREKDWIWMEVTRDRLNARLPLLSRLLR